MTPDVKMDADKEEERREKKESRVTSRRGESQRQELNTIELRKKNMDSRSFDKAQNKLRLAGMTERAHRPFDKAQSRHAPLQKATMKNKNDKMEFRVVLPQLEMEN